jgi:hypothetical protein
MTANTNPISYNQYIDQIGVMAVALTQDNGSGVQEFVDAPLQEIVPMMLNYAELRIQRDLDLLPALTANNYTATPGQALLIPIDDFLIIESINLAQLDSLGQAINETPLTQVSREFIANCYGGLSSIGTPKYYAMVGDNFGNAGDVYNRIRFAPLPNYAYTVSVRGVIRLPSLYKNAAAGIADTGYTYISTNYPDMLVIASMIYITMFQRNFSATSDDSQMGMNYEKQYQILKATAVMEENRKKGQGSAWSGYSTPVSATPTR